VHLIATEPFEFVGVERLPERLISDQRVGSEPEPPETIIVSFKLTIGKIARLGISAFHNEAITSIRPHLADPDPYLFKVLPEFARRGDTKGAIKGATLNRDSISNILLPLPPLAEQHRIVAKVDELMGLCDRLEAARASREGTRDQLTVASLARLNAPDAETFQGDARFALGALPALTARPDQIKALRQTILNLAVRGKLVAQDPNDEPARNC
jgi:type I restriction enzyme, S subunit